MERDFHIVAQIGAALAAGTAATTRRHAENAFEQIGKCGAEFGPEAGGAAAQALLERGVTEAVIGRALIRVLQDLVGFVEFLETVLGVLVARIAIRVELHRLFAKGGLDVAVARGPFDREGLVVAALGHQSLTFKNRRMKPDHRRTRTRTCTPVSIAGVEFCQAATA